MRDRAFLEWLAQRLVNVYGESPDVDYVTKLQSIAEATDPDKVTPNIARIKS